MVTYLQDSENMLMRNYIRIRQTVYVEHYTKLQYQLNVTLKNKL